MKHHVIAGRQSKPLLQPALRRSSSWHAFFKAGGEYVLASFALLVFLPSMLIISILIKLDSDGPFIVRCRCRGASGKTIAVLKFRTAASPKAGAMEKRLTRVGRFLRQTRLDELPMLLNVLSGDISLSGPWPRSLD